MADVAWVAEVVRRWIGRDTAFLVASEATHQTGTNPGALSVTVTSLNGKRFRLTVEEID